MEAFLVLSNGRTLTPVVGADKGMVLRQAITLQEIKAYIDIFNIPSEQEFIYYIQALDTTYRDLIGD